MPHPWEKSGLAILQIKKLEEEKEEVDSCPEIPKLKAPRYELEEILEGKKLKFEGAKSRKWKDRIP
jgi:hypothetical protein